MPKLIERVLAHLILPSLSKSYGLLSSRQASVEPNDHSIASLNVKHKSGSWLKRLWKSINLGLGPILPREIFDPAKLSCVGCDYCHLVAECLTRDQQIIFTNWPPNGFRLRTKFACKSRILFVEDQWVNWSGKKADKQLSIHLATTAL
jgi:hypothetical protein